MQELVSDELRDFVEKLHANKGYDYARCQRACGKRGIRRRIARRGEDSSERLASYCWVV